MNKPFYRIPLCRCYTFQSMHMECVSISSATPFHCWNEAHVSIPEKTS